MITTKQKDKPMSDTPTTTPRTDANTYSAETLAISAERIKVVHADFSKQLETELTAAQKERDNLKHELEISRSESDEYREQRDRLAEALQRIIEEDGRPMSMRVCSTKSLAQQALLNQNA